MTICKQSILPGILAILLAVSGTATAAGNHNDLSRGMGRIDYLNLAEGEIVVGDVALSLGTNYVVRDRTGKVVSAFNLRKGMRVEVRHDANNTVTEIVIK